MKNTNWVVITGGPCSGKTSVINALAARNYPISEEVARKYYLALFEYQNNPDILEDHAALQNTILQMELRREEMLDSSQRIFFDRALPDSIAYYRQESPVPDYVTSIAKRFYYRTVFFLEELPEEESEFSSKNKKIIKRLGRYIHEAYQSLGYRVIDVPSLSVEARVDFILEKLAALASSES